MSLSFNLYSVPPQLNTAGDEPLSTSQAKAMLITAVLLFLSATLSSAVDTCPAQCMCSNQTALCSSRWFRGIKEYYGLLELTLINTGLKSLNNSLFPSTVVMLSIRHNQRLTAVDKSAFINLVHLKSLRISHSPDLTSIPFSLFLNNQKLTFLDLSFNNLESMHYSTLMPLANLVELRLQGNRFTTFDVATFAHLVHLKKLKLDYNHIDFIQPTLFSATLSLEELYLNNNNLVSLPERMFLSTTELRVLDLSFNFLSILPPYLFQSQGDLIQLFLSWNYLANLNATMLSTLSNLEVLKLDGNELHHLKSEIFNPLKKLRSLNISANYLLECDSDLKMFLEWCQQNSVQLTTNASCRYFGTSTAVSLSIFYEQSKLHFRRFCLVLGTVTLLLLRMALDIFLYFWFSRRAQGSFYPIISFSKGDREDDKPLASSRTPPLVHYKQDMDGSACGEPVYEYIDMDYVRNAFSVKNMNYYEVPLPQPLKVVDKSPPMNIPRKKAPSPPSSTYDNF